MVSQRYLLQKSTLNPRDVTVFWIDGHGTCEKYHVSDAGELQKARYHIHRDRGGRAWAYLCPNGLEPDEWKRVFTDEPVGSWKDRYLSYREEPQKSKRQDFEKIES